jgi:O-antigen/teichoic acid export membrane protein
MKSRLLKDVAVMALTRILSLAGAAAINVLVSRVLGPAGRGSYALPIIDCGLAATLIMGFSSALPYFMLKTGVDRGLLRPIFRAMVLFILAGAALTVAIGLSNRQLWALLPALVYLPFYALLTIVSGYCIGRNQIRFGGLLNVAVPFITLASVAAGFLLFGRTAHVAVLGWLCGTVVTAVCAVAITIRYVRPDRSAAIQTRDFVRFAAKAGTLNMVTVLNYRIDVYIVAMIAPLATLGLYSVAVAGAEAAVALAHSFSLAMQPRVGSLDRTGAAIFTARCSRSNLLFAALLCTLVALIAGPAVKVVFGIAFLPVVPVLRVLLIGVVALSVGTVLTNYFLLNTGRTLVPLSAGAFSALICAIVSLILVPRIGMMGAAIGTATSYVLSQIINIYWFCRESGIKPVNVLFIDGTDVDLYKRMIQGKLSRAT